MQNQKGILIQEKPSWIICTLWSRHLYLKKAQALNPCLWHRFSAFWGLHPLDPWGLHPNTHYIVNPSTHHIVNPSTHHIVNPSTHHYQLSCCLYIHYHVCTIYTSVLFTYISTFTSHSHFTSNAHFIIFLSIVCYIFTSPHFCVLLWYFHNFHMSLFPSFNTFLFHHLSIYPFSCLSTSHILHIHFPFWALSHLIIFMSTPFYVYSIFIWVWPFSCLFILLSNLYTNYIFLSAHFFCLYFYRTIQSVHFNWVNNISSYELFFPLLIL